MVWVYVRRERREISHTVVMGVVVGMTVSIKSSSTRASKSENHSQKRRMSESSICGTRRFDCDFDFPSHEWSCSHVGLFHNSSKSS